MSVVDTLTVVRLRTRTLGGAMKLPRRKFLHLAAGIAAVPATARIARAQAYPTGPVRLIVDIAARELQWIDDVGVRREGQTVSVGREIAEIDPCLIFERGEPRIG